MMGVTWEDSQKVANLLGLKIFMSEFIAYRKLSDMQNANILSVSYPLLSWNIYMACWSLVIIICHYFIPSPISLGPKLSLLLHCVDSLIFAQWGSKSVVLEL